MRNPVAKYGRRICRAAAHRDRKVATKRDGQRKSKHKRAALS